MSSPPPIEPFKGNGTWEECDDFIRAIRMAAWEEGKFRDTAWVADFAALYFSRKALLWHSQLPEDVRQDWSKLETCILTRWASSEDNDGLNMEPAPAAAPSSNPNAKADLSHYGVLKLAVDKSNSVYYIDSSDSGPVGSLTNDVNKALRVRCNSVPNGNLLERIDDSSHSWLAIHWRSGTPNMGVGSTDYARLSLVDSDTMKSSWTNGAPWQLIKCLVAVNGELSLIWKDSTRKIPLSPFVNDSSLYLATDPEAYSKHFTDEKRAKLFIDPIDFA